MCLKCGVRLLFASFPYPFVDFVVSYRPAPVDQLNQRVYVRFPDVHDVSKYRGPPTDEVDRAWEDLYNSKPVLGSSRNDTLLNSILTLVGISAIPKSEAAKLQGPTEPFINQPDHYIVMLDVFHQLHCLVRAAWTSFPD